MLLQAEARDPNNLALTAPWEQELAQEVEAGRAVDGHFRCRLPVFAPPGPYQIRLRASDKLKNAGAKFTAEFQVDAPVVAPAARLEMRDFAQALSVEGPWAEDVTLTGGGTVHMKWKLCGIAVSGGKVSVQVALKVLGPRGQVVLEEPKYLAVDDTLFYQPPVLYLPMNGTLTLPASAPKGRYKLEYTATDAVANAEAGLEAQVEVR